MRINKNSKKFKSFKHILGVIITSIITSIITCTVTLTFNSFPNFIAEQAILKTNDDNFYRYVYIYNTKSELKNANATMYYIMHFFGYNDTEKEFVYYSSSEHNFDVKNKRFSFYENPEERYNSLGEAFMYVYEDTRDLELLPKIEIYIEINYDNFLNIHKRNIYKLENNNLIELKDEEEKITLYFLYTSVENKFYNTIWEFYDSQRSNLGIYHTSNRESSGEKEAIEKFNCSDDFIEYIDKTHHGYYIANFSKRLKKSLS